MPPSSPLDGRSYSQKSTVVRQALVTPFCCFLYPTRKTAQEMAHVRSQRKVTASRPLIFIYEEKKKKKRGLNCDERLKKKNTKNNTKNNNKKMESELPPSLSVYLCRKKEKKKKTRKERKKKKKEKKVEMLL